MTFKTINSISDIYDGKEVIFLKGHYICPVCKKEYKRESIAKNHLEKQECYDVKALIRNTEREKKAMALFASIMESTDSKSKASLFRFRKNKLYGPIAKFSMFCSYFEIKNPELYYAWVRDIKGFKHANAILSNALKEENMYEYRKWLRQNPEFIENATFVDQNDPYINMDSEEFDIHVLIRSMEKSHISLVYYLQFYGITVDDIPATDLEYRNRLVTLVGEIE